MQFSQVVWTMGAQASQPRKVARSVSFNGSQRDVYREFDVQLFKIDCEVRFTPELHCEKVSEIKQKLYCLRQEFDSSKMKDKYELDFRYKYRRVIDNLEWRIQNSQKTRKRPRKKRLAPLPPLPEQMKEFLSEITEIRGITTTFHARRDGDRYNKLHHRILSLLFKITSLETGSDKQKYDMTKNLLEILKQLEETALENDETAVSCD